MRVMIFNGKRVAYCNPLKRDLDVRYSFKNGAMDHDQVRIF